MTREKAYDAAAATQRGTARRPPPAKPSPRRRARGGVSAPTHSKVRRGVVRFHAADADGRRKEGGGGGESSGKATTDATVALRVADAVPDSAMEYHVRATGKNLMFLAFGIGFETNLNT